jgi:hypothetical protein
MGEDSLTMRCSAEHPEQLGVLCAEVNGHIGRHWSTGPDGAGAWTWSDWDDEL